MRSTTTKPGASALSRACVPRDLEEFAYLDRQKYVKYWRLGPLWFVGSDFAYFWCPGTQVQDGVYLSPEGPCNLLVDAWTLNGFLYPYFGVYVGAIMILGPFGLGRFSPRPGPNYPLRDPKYRPVETTRPFVEVHRGGG